MLYRLLEYLGGNKQSVLYVLLYAMFCLSVLFFILFFVIAYFKMLFVTSILSICKIGIGEFYTPVV